VKQLVEQLVTSCRFSRRAVSKSLYS